jgi:hypothetical protein
MWERHIHTLAVIIAEHVIWRVAPVNAVRHFGAMIILQGAERGYIVQQQLARSTLLACNSAAMTPYREAESL